MFQTFSLKFSNMIFSVMQLIVGSYTPKNTFLRPFVVPVNNLACFIFVYWIFCRGVCWKWRRQLRDRENLWRNVSQVKHIQQILCSSTSRLSWCSFSNGLNIDMHRYNDSNTTLFYSTFNMVKMVMILNAGSNWIYLMVWILFKSGIHRAYTILLVLVRNFKHSFICFLVSCRDL